MKLRYIWAIYLLKQLYLAQSSRAAAKTKCDRGRLKSRSIGHVRPRTVEIPSVSFLVIILLPTPPPTQYLNLLVEVWQLGVDGGINTWGWKIDSHWWKEILKVRCNTHVMLLLSQNTQAWPELGQVSDVYVMTHLIFYRLYKERCVLWYRHLGTWLVSQVHLGKEAI